jgi:uncharacterized phage-associated protein
MNSALDVAWYFVQKGNGDPSITQLKLQKLCYYAQGFYLARFGSCLFSEDIEAWDYGPVVPRLREIHADRGAEPISPEEPAFGNPILNSSVSDLLDSVWRNFGYYSAGTLVDMTHSESPWIEAYGAGQNTRISERVMQNYFIQRLENLGSSTDSGSCESISAIYLKDGQSVNIPSSEAEKFLLENEQVLEPKHIKVRGKRRSLSQVA